MTVEIVQQEIERFLSSKEPEVLCFTGKWGVGKSFSWVQYLKAAKAKKGIRLERYAYVSLFGLNSIDELKLAIIEATISTANIGQSLDLKSVRSDPLGAFKENWAKVLAKLPAIAGAKDAEAIVQQWLFRNVREEVICLDDLERKGEGLKIKDVFGLVSFLKEQRECKVAIILNDGVFDGPEKEDFDQYFEKTIDSHVRFEPTAVECAQIALPGDSAIHRKMRRLCVKLGISNIRVIRRLERLAAMLQPLLREYHYRVFHQFLKDLVVLGWAKFAEDTPSLEFLEKRRSAFYTGREQPSEDEKRWGPLLDAYGFRYFSPISAIMLRSLEQGFFEQNELVPEARKLHAGHVKRKSEAKFHAAWRKFHDGFDDNEDELVKSLNESFISNVQYIAPVNANSSIRLLRDLGRDDLASDLTKLYVSERGVETFDSQNMFSADDVTDPEFVEAIKEKQSSVGDQRDPKEVLLKIARESGWSPKDIALLSQVDVDGYYKIFKSISDGDDLRSCIRMALGLVVGDRERAIAENARAALMKIGGESDLNRLRVAKYGVVLDEANDATG